MGLTTENQRQDLEGRQRKTTHHNDSGLLRNYEAHKIVERIFKLLQQTNKQNKQTKNAILKAVEMFNNIPFHSMTTKKTNLGENGWGLHKILECKQRSRQQHPPWGVILETCGGVLDFPVMES